MGRTCSKRYWDVHVMRDGHPRYLGFVRAYTKVGAAFFALRKFALPPESSLQNSSQICIASNEKFSVTPLT